MMASMRIFTLMFIAFFAGCGLVELRVDVIQRTILDSGDYTKDGYSRLNSKQERGPITEEANQETSTQHHIAGSQNEKTDTTVETDVETKLY